MPADLQPNAARHPIGVVAERTGLSPHVLRVWERRYRVVEPSRAEGKQRLYSDADIDRLRLIRLATLAGRRGIGQVARLSTEELECLAREDEEAAIARRRVGARRGESAAPLTSGASAEVEVERALAMARAMSGADLELLLRRDAALLGVPAFLDTIASPLLRRMHDDWQGDDRLAPAQERLLAAVMQRVLDAIVHFLAVPPGAPNLLLATPPGARHPADTGLAAAAAAAEGWQVIPLGAELPVGEIAGAAAAARVDAVGVSVAQVADRERLLGDLRALRALLPAAVPLLVGGAATDALAPDLRGSGISIVEDLTALRAALGSGRRPSWA